MSVWKPCAYICANDSSLYCIIIATNVITVLDHEVKKFEVSETKAKRQLTQSKFISIHNLMSSDAYNTK